MASAGNDIHSLYLQPIFTSPPLYGDPINKWGFRIPKTAAEARGWFRLRSGSPGRGAASDGKDLGILF
jgi:hypothetical protein